jgi:hypothetical protein
VSETKEPKKRCRGNLPAVATAGSVARAADSEATVGEQELAEEEAEALQKLRISRTVRFSGGR